MGAGKSSVGALLAQKLDYTFVETDRLIESQTGMSISDLFKYKGEAQFREFESKIVQEVSLHSNQVIALGGGAFVNVQNREILSQSGIVIYLCASVEALAQRIQSEVQNERQIELMKRPLLSSLANIKNSTDLKTALENKLQDILESRKTSYECADYQIDTTGQSPLEVVETLCKNLPKWQKAKTC